MRLVTAYTLLYNTISFLLWSLILPRPSHTLVSSLQLLSLLDILHSLLGLGGSLPATLFQFSGRGFIQFLILPITPPSTYPTLLHLTWVTSEVIRFPYYITKTLKVTPNWLKTLRYTAWRYLYPPGITLELLCVWEKLKPWKIDAFHVGVGAAVVVGYGVGVYTIFNAMSRASEKALKKE